MRRPSAGYTAIWTLKLPLAGCPGCVLILQGRQIRPEDRESIEHAQVARPGSGLVWLPSRDHEFGVVGWGPFAIHPGELTNTVSDITLIFIKTGQVSKQ